MFCVSNYFFEVLYIFFEKTKWNYLRVVGISFCVERVTLSHRMNSSPVLYLNTKHVDTCLNQQGKVNIC